MISLVSLCLNSGVSRFTRKKNFFSSLPWRSNCRLSWKPMVKLPCSSEGTLRMVAPAIPIKQFTPTRRMLSLNQDPLTGVWLVSVHFIHCTSEVSTNTNFIRRGQRITQRYITRLAAVHAHIVQQGDNWTRWVRNSSDRHHQGWLTGQQGEGTLHVTKRWLYGGWRRVVRRW